ncbi:DUF3048 domain-containing protein [Paenibacillus gansuensis]|uniref:DUF3048 domain-containing protein n=1 Tax=Paenibacillus gansuensis TaxID=306542 RepID=A0ABW5P965_9BACL
MTLIKRYRTAGLLTLAAAMAFSTAACSNPGKQETVQEQPPGNTAPEKPSNTAETPVPETPAPHTFPLTGLGTEQPVTERPLMFMVENSPKARPQSGLDQADIVYEVLAEGEITRFLAVFQSQAAETVGPVRSIRPYFVQLGEELDAVMVHAGWSQDAMNILTGHRLDHFDEVYGDGAYYWRDKSRKMPHNLYSSVAKIRDAVEDRKKRQEWMPVDLQFAAKDAPAPAGTPAVKIAIPYIAGYDVGYEYDAAAGLYKRVMEGKPHEDRITGKQLTASNVLICYTKHQVLDKAGRRNVDIYGPGKGYLVQKGVAQEITWENKGGAIRAYKDGQELSLIPGQTWVQIVPNGSKVTFE